MLKFFGGLPRWLTVVLALAAAAALWVIPYLTASSHGWKLILWITFGAVFTILAVGLPQIQQWQSKQESRLQIELMTEPSELTIPSYNDADEVIEAWLKSAEADCLSSLHPPRSVHPSRGFDAGAFDIDKLHGGSDADGSLANLTLQELRQIEKKRESGEKLTDEDEKTLAAFQAKMASIVSEFSGTFSNQMSDPDERTVEDYRSEVEQYLAGCRKFFDERLLQAYVKSGAGRLRVALVNPTGRVFENVQVEVYLPGKVQASNPEEMNEEHHSLPSRPRAFGERVPKPLFTFPSYSGLPTRAYITKQHSGPIIDNSGSARVVYRPVSLRPDARIVLDDIALSIQELPGSVIEGTWEATATNAEGRMRGRMSIKVDNTFVLTRELLSGLL